MVHIYTDGGCSGNPGKGGYGIVVMDEKESQILYTFYETIDYTTNNRMELSALIKAFEYLLEMNIAGTIYTDSAYGCGIVNKWMFGWAQKNWKNSKGREAENIDLVKKIYNYQVNTFHIWKVEKTSGHQGILGNELADALATDNIQKFMKLIKQHKINWQCHENLTT